jgi:hypothetical protein
MQLSGPGLYSTRTEILGQSKNNFKQICPKFKNATEHNKASKPGGVKHKNKVLVKMIFRAGAGYGRRADISGVAGTCFWTNASTRGQTSDTPTSKRHSGVANMHESEQGL